MEDPCDVLDALVEEAERRRVREHEPGRPLVHLAAEVVEVEVPACVGLDLLELVAGHRDARRVRPVRGVGGDDRVALLAAVREVRAHEHEAGELSLRARSGLQRHRGKARDLGEDSLQVPHELERALRPVVLLVRMQVAESRQPRDTLVDTWVVLHRAAPEWIEARVDAERAVGQRRDVSDDLGLRHLGKPRRTRSTRARAEARASARP